MLFVHVSRIDVTNDTDTKKKNNEDKEIQLSLRTEELIDDQNANTFCMAILKAINYTKMLPDKYFISYKSLLQEVKKEDDKLVQAWVVHLALSK